MKAKRLIFLFFCYLCLVGCVSTTVVDVTSKPAIKAVNEVAEDQLLDIGIKLFDPGVPEDREEAAKKFIKSEVRNAEASFVPYTLRKVLEETENWGAVRITPRTTEAVDVQVGGKILMSDGEVLKVHVYATDATGRVWLDKKYTDVATSISYQEEVTDDEEPFLDLYNNIANDLLEARRHLLSDDLDKIRTVSKLKFAAEISPYAFQDYYEVDRKGDVEIKRLPSEDDPMIERIDKIRDREYAFIDLLDEHYEDFHDNMSQPYDDWRRFSYEETVQLREIMRSSRLTTMAGILITAGGVVARNKSDSAVGRTAGSAAIYSGVNLIKGGFDLRKESEIHSVALGELGDSFAQEVQPMLVEVEGRTVELTGSAEEQFAKWRQILRQIYESETGLVVPESAMPTPELKHPDEPRVEQSSEDANHFLPED